MRCVPFAMLASSVVNVTFNASADEFVMHTHFTVAELVEAAETLAFEQGASFAVALFFLAFVAITAMVLIVCNRDRIRSGCCCKQRPPVAEPSIVHFLKSLAPRPSTTAADDGDKCPICQEQFASDPAKMAATTACKHDFHIACLARWWTQFHQCPVCRAAIGQFPAAAAHNDE